MNFRRVAIASFAVLFARSGMLLAQENHSREPVTLRARAVRGAIVLELGPFALPARADHEALVQPQPLVATLPRSGWLRGLSVDLVDSAGAPVPRAALHHVNLIVPDKRELFSPIMLRIGAAGQETAPVTLPRLIGYRVERGDSVIVSAMVHNPTDRAYGGVRLRVRLPFVPDDSRVGALSVFPFYLDVRPPAGTHEFDLPPGRTEMFWEGKPATGGRVLVIGGHLHTLAVALRFEDRTTGRVVWEAKPIVDSTGRIVGMPTKSFLHRLGVRIHRDHVYRLTAIYDNPTDETIVNGGMGALGGVLIPDDRRLWPAVARDDPEYQKDVRVTFRLDATPGEHGGHHH